jgi:hypothetical protein
VVDCKWRRSSSSTRRRPELGGGGEEHVPGMKKVTVGSSVGQPPLEHEPSSAVYNGL